MSDFYHFEISFIVFSSSNQFQTIEAMHRILPFFFTLVFSLSLSAQSDLIITGVIDGPLFGGQPKAVELYALNDINDLSQYSLGAANNGGGSDGEEYTFPADVVGAGSFIYLTASEADFIAFFDFAPDYVEDGMDSPVNINGDDAIELFQNGTVVDVFGDIQNDGTGSPWEYLDGWVYRVDGTGPDGDTFIQQNWTYSGVNALDDETSNAFANVPFPAGSYSPDGSDFVIANDDFINLEINGTAEVDVFANDLIPGDLVSFAISEDPSNGVAVFDTGLLNYFPNNNFCGRDTVEYEACNLISCDSALLIIQIDCPFSYPVYDIATVTTEDDNGIADSLEVLCELQGIVYGIDTRGGEGIQFTLIDENNNGINVFSGSETFGYTVQQGDELIIRGEIDQFNGLTEIIPDELILVSTGNSLVSATGGLAAPSEATESSLIEVGVSIVDESQWGVGVNGYNIDVTNGVDTFVMRIDDDTEMFGGPFSIIPDPLLFGVVGIGGQFDDTEPYTEGYQIQPRFETDFYFILNSIDPKFDDLIRVSPNPAYDVLTIEMKSSFDQVIIRDMNGRIIDQFTPQSLRSDILVNNWASGVYSITFVKDNRIWTTRVVK